MDHPTSIGEYEVHDILFQTNRHSIYETCDNTFRKFVLKESKNDQDLDREFQLLIKLNHSNIVKPKEYLRTNGLSYIVFPIAQGGDLLDRFSAEGGPFEEISVRKMLRGIFEAVEYLHSNNIIHRNITIENILIYYFRGKEIYVLGGFSLAIISPATKKDYFGALPYMAPELIQKKEYDNKIDCWSLGIVMYALLSYCFPYSDGFKENEVIDYSNFSLEAQDLVSQLLCVDPKERISVKQALEHPFFESYNDDE